MSLLYNIESIKKINLDEGEYTQKQYYLITGWAFDENEPVQVKVENTEINVRFFDRTDVFDTFKVNNSLHSGMRLIIFNVNNLDVLNIIFEGYSGVSKNYIINVSKIKHEEYLQGNLGYCPICEYKSVFYKKDNWLRDNYFCLNCNSIPRQRAIVRALNIFAPNWKELVIHESSPGGVSSNFIKQSCCFYNESQFFKNVSYGEYFEGIRCENLENLTLEDCSLDIFITQDVFEHIMNPIKAFKEIDRVLKIGGLHIFTVPIYEKLIKSVQRAKIENDMIKYICKPVYHGNPIDDSGSLVTYDYGLDIVNFIGHSMSTIIYLEKDKYFGLDGEFLHVLVSKKLEVNYKT